MALDQPTLALLAVMADAQVLPTHQLTPAEARANEAVLIDMIGPGPDVARVEEIELIPQGGHAFGVRTLVPEGELRAVIVYFHGGGWVLGSIDQFDTLGRELANRTGCAVVLVDYRKAPEFPFPAAVEDCWQALRWVDDNLARIAGVRVPLIVAGDSAGGNLAAVMTFRARDAGAPHLAFQVLIYPVTNNDVDNRSYREPSNQLLLNRDTMLWYWHHYVPDPVQRFDPEASPLQAPVRAGLPPAVVLLAEHDVLRNEGDAYADGLRRAGVAVEQRTFACQMHGFFSMINVLPASAEAMDYVAAAIAHALADQA